MADIIISIEHLGKRYRLRHQGAAPRYTALRDVIADQARGLLRRLRPSSALRPPPSALSSQPSAPGPQPLASSEDFWALQDVSFEVRRGEVLGIIGRNGAGKSTLLKVLSRITEPTTGRVHLRGRVASLLEVGTGFHPELTGRENIFLNGAILGMSRAEIKAKFDEIVAFAEVERFLDTPVKHYSSGMYVRLAFAVAAHLEPEILIVDEVLAVGDVQFQQKCLGKMEQVSRGGRTVLLVSHNLRTVSALCSACLWFRRGAIAGVGPPAAVIADYLKDGPVDRSLSRSLAEVPRPEGVGKLMKFLSLKLGATAPNGNVVMGEPLVFDLQAKALEPLHEVFFGLGIDDLFGHRLFTVEGDRHPLHEVGRGQVVRARITIPDCGLRPGAYAVTLGINSGINECIDHLPEALSFEIVAGTANLMQAGRTNLGLCLSAKWELEISSGTQPSAG